MTYHFVCKEQIDLPSRLKQEQIFEKFRRGIALRRGASCLFKIKNPHWGCSSQGYPIFTWYSDFEKGTVILYPRIPLLRASSVLLTIKGKSFLTNASLQIVITATILSKIQGNRDFRRRVASVKFMFAKVWSPSLSLFVRLICTFIFRMQVDRFKSVLRRWCVGTRWYVNTFKCSNLMDPRCCRFYDAAKKRRLK